LKDPFLFQWCYEKELAPYFAPIFQRATASRATESSVPAAGIQSKTPADDTTAVAPAPGGS